jgi:hypothetical protein
MFAKALFTSAALALCASAEVSDELKRQYKTWEVQMGTYQYDWEPFEVTTDDGYTLTIMHITNKRGGESSVDPALNPILIVPAMGSTPDTWTSVFVYNDPPDNAI